MPATHRRSEEGATGQLERAETRRRHSRSRWVAAGGAAAAMGTAAAYNLYRASQAERGFPPKGRFIDVDGVKLHYLEKGSGRPLILLHGNGAFVQDFELSGLLDAAAQRYRVIAFDRPGFGYSERPRSMRWTPTAQAELLWEAITALGIERPIILGHSLGTMVALSMALARQDQTSALVLLGGYYFPTARPDVPVVSPPALPLIGDLMRWTISPISGQLMSSAMFKAMFAPHPVPERFTAWPLGLALRPSQIRAAAADAAFMVPAARHLSRDYHELRIPVVIMAGEKDKIAHVHHHAAALHQAIEGSEFMVVPGEGHMLHYGATDEVIRAVDLAASSDDKESSLGDGQP